MLLHATWRCDQQVEPRQWKFRTIHGIGTGSISSDATNGCLTLRLGIDLGTAFTDAGRFTALGASAFVELPPVAGSGCEIRMTAVPPLWLEDPRRVTALFRRADALAEIEGRTLRVKGEKLSPTRLLRRASLVALALDPFTKRRTPPEKLQKLRRTVQREFGSDGDWLFELLHESALERAIREALGIRRESRQSRTLTERALQSAPSPGSILTSLGFRVTPEQASWDRAGAALAKRTVDPKWLIYLPPEMCSIQDDSVSDPLEHPQPAFNYYRNEGIEKLVVELKHMGSRAIVILCRDQSVSRRRFRTSGLGTVYTRNGRPFFDDPSQFLFQLHTGLSRTNFWERFNTDWVCLDGECLPWSLKAEKLIDETHFEVLESAEALDHELERLPLLSPEEHESLAQRRRSFESYRNLLYSYQSQSGMKPSFAPFQIVATEGVSHLKRTHLWQMETLHRIANTAGEPFTSTPFQFVKDEQTARQTLSWWEELAERAEEGFVVKPLYAVPKGRRGHAQPAIKCRTPEHLRLVYGPDYDLLENRWALAGRESLTRRREKHRRVLRQFALCLDAVQGFVDGANEAYVQERVRAILSLHPASVL